MSYYHTKESVKEYIRLADGYDGATLISELKKYISPGLWILELGSGPGKDWKILSEQYMVMGSDYSKEFIEYLNQEHPNGEFLELNASTLMTDKKFDVVYSNKVMHHLEDKELIQSFKRQHELLNDSGVICHSFWKGESSEVFKGLFVNYLLEADLEELCKKQFDVLVLKDYAEFDEGDSLLLIARKKNNV